MPRIREFTATPFVAGHKIDGEPRNLLTRWAYRIRAEGVDVPVTLEQASEPTDAEILAALETAKAAGRANEELSPTTKPEWRAVLEERGADLLPALLWWEHEQALLDATAPDALQQADVDEIYSDIVVPLRAAVRQAAAQWAAL